MPTFFNRAKILKNAFVFAFLLTFTFCGGEGTPDYCSDGHPYNATTQFCHGGQPYEKCGTQPPHYDPTEKFCRNNNLYNFCNGFDYNPGTEFCADNRIIDKCNGFEFAPATEGCVHGNVMSKCGRNFYDSEDEFCFENRHVFQMCNTPNFDPATFNPDIGCNGSPTLPTCDGEEYDPNNKFCFYDERQDDFDTHELCGGADYDVNTHECVNDEVVQKGQTNTNRFSVTVVSAGTGATGDGTYNVGAAVTIFAGTPPENHVFVNWTTSNTIIFADRESAETWFTMPANAVTVTANFQDTTTPPPSTYRVTISNAGADASGAGDYEEGVRVTIFAGTPPENHVFVNWTTTSAGVVFDSANSVTTTFIMPSNAVTVTANFEVDIPDDPIVTPTCTAGEDCEDDVGSCTVGETCTNEVKREDCAGDFVYDSSCPINDLQPGGQFNQNITYGTFTDTRNNKTYRYITIGTQDWMAENLNYATQSGSWCYDDDPFNCDIYGRLYDWATAMNFASSCNNGSCASQIQTNHQGICPNGWRIPSSGSSGDWSALRAAVGGSTVGTKLKSSMGWETFSSIPIGTDDFGFSALPGGYRLTDGTFNLISNQGRWWTITESGVVRLAQYHDMRYDSDGMFGGSLDKRHGASVRCVRDN